jgi:hypothetical protein
VPIYKALLVYFSVFAGTLNEHTNIKPHEHFGMPTIVFFLSSYLMGYLQIIQGKKKEQQQASCCTTGSASGLRGISP